jgi:predicted DNA-binding transcriptional regulator AlpA
VKHRKMTEPAALPSRFLTPVDLADMLGVPVQTLYQWRYLGQGPPGFRIGRHLRYDPVAVRRWIDDRMGDPGDRAA